MSHIKTLLFLLLLATHLVGCSASDTDANCGDGTAREIDGQTYCLYQSNLIIEGFECPNQMTPHEVPNGMVCSPDDKLPDDLINPFDPQDPWCVANCDVITDPNPPVNKQPSPANASDFRRIYRQQDYACVVDSSDKATCWGPAFDGTLKTLDRTYTNVSQMTLSRDFLCVLNTNQSIKCHGAGFANDFDANKKYTSITSSAESVCALGGVEAPFNQLNCINTQSAGASFAQLAKSNQWIDKPFNQFTLKMGGDGGRIASGCGVNTNGDIQCLTSQQVQITGPYKEIQNNALFFVCGINAQNEVNCWNMDNTSTELPAPEGKFIELYGPECGLLETNKVVCWHELELGMSKDQTLTLTPLFNEHPRAFDVHQTIGSQQASGWCAIKLDGNIECSDF